MTSPDSWEALGHCDGAPVHSEELMAGHVGRPTVAVQSETHGAPAPDEDRGVADENKYGTGGI